MKIIKKLKHYQVRYVRLTGTAVLFVSTIVLIIILLCTNIFAPANKQAALPTATAALPTETPLPTNRAKLQFAGDIVLANQLLAFGKTSSGYDFTPAFSAISNYVDGDLSIFNLEGVLNGDGQNSYSGQPVYNYPVEIADAASKAGFHAAITANDQALNKGATGLSYTKTLLTSVGINAIGTYDSEDEYNKYWIQNVNGISVGILAYTDSLKSTSQRKAYNIRVLDTSKKEAALETVKADMAAMRSSGAEFLIVSLHWGQSSLTSPSDTQKWLAQNIIENGADMIYGTLPFTTEKITYKEFTLADGTKKNAVVAYSIGNLLCHPTVSGSQVTQESLILNVNVERDASGKPVITAVSYVPIYTMAYQQSNKTYMYRILPSAVYAQAATQPEDIPSQDEWTKCKMAFIDIKKVVESTSGNLAIQLVDQ